MAQTVYQYGCYFFLYAFLGWCCEVIYAAVRRGTFVNRGFLNGPVCPIYGAGIVLVTAALAPVKDDLLWLYLGSVLLTSAVELVTGFAMEKLFHHRWWDYSKQPLNIGGYICPLFSLVWGAACVGIVKILHPLMERLVLWIPRTPGWILLGLIAAGFAADCVVTVLTVAKLNRRLDRLDEAAQALRRLSDGIGEGLAEGAIALHQKGEIFREQKRERMGCMERRLLRAFPQMRSLRHGEALEELKRLAAKKPLRRKDKEKRSRKKDA